MEVSSMLHSSQRVPQMPCVDHEKPLFLLFLCAMFACCATAATPTVALSPTSGSGYSGTFTFSGTDTSGYTDIDWVQMYIDTSLKSTNTCLFTYFVSTNEIQAYTDTGSAR